MERARGVVGLSTAEIVDLLVRAGAQESLLAQAEPTFIAECLAAFCVTGSSRSWGVAEAYRAPVVQPAEKVKEDIPAAIYTSAACQQVCRSPTASDTGATTPPRGEDSEAPTTPPESPPEGSILADGACGLGGLTSLKEKALSTALHVGLRGGSAARMAGAVAAIGCEGYVFYQDINEHQEKLSSRDISSDQYAERVCESGVTSSGRALGGIAGAAAGQAAIPIPIVGAVIGGLVGAACGGIHANSLVRGALRLSGSQAKGGDDLVRVVEHQRPVSPTGGGCHVAWD